MRERFVCLLFSLCAFKTYHSYSRAAYAARFILPFQHVHFCTRSILLTLRTPYVFNIHLIYSNF